MIHRIGPVTADFFVELSDILEHPSTSDDALLLAGDVNIYLERALDTTTIELIDLLECYSLQHVTGGTHNAGGTIDVVYTRCDLPPPTVDIIDASLSDHTSATLGVEAPSSAPSLQSQNLTVTVFRTSLSASVLCDE